MPINSKSSSATKTHLLVPVALTTGIVLAASLSLVKIATVGRNAPLAAADSDPMVAAAGDIACDPDKAQYNQGNGTVDACHMKATSELLVGQNFAAVLPLGDTQYENATLSKFQQSYDRTWGRVKAISYPAAGNHEYLTPGASGYFSYFGAAAGESTKGYYSYNIGNWHIIALNGNCTYIGGCEAGSPQEIWLKADLAASSAVCTLAYWHQPRFSSGLHSNDSTYDAFWQDLYNAHADIVLNGHDHHYERFAPQTPKAEADPRRGIREFVVGTGGKNLYPILTAQANSQIRNADTYGILKLVLHPDRYSWAFIPEAGKTFTDSGDDLCH
jgi:hypothetical protein